ncbi:hypothetical protein TNCV_3616701 [Trichonephila clavipes]|nr:hypothetical protein TNCV_3616701 [Trichonephila clavipes]
MSRKTAPVLFFFWKPSEIFSVSLKKWVNGRELVSETILIGIEDVIFIDKIFQSMKNYRFGYFTDSGKERYWSETGCEMRVLARFVNGENNGFFPVIWKVIEFEDFVN